MSTPATRDEQLVAAQARYDKRASSRVAGASARELVERCQRERVAMALTTTAGEWGDLLRRAGALESYGDAYAIGTILAMRGLCISAHDGITPYEVLAFDAADMGAYLLARQVPAPIATLVAQWQTEGRALHPDLAARALAAATVVAAKKVSKDGGEGVLASPTLDSVTVTDIVVGGCEFEEGE